MIRVSTSQFYARSTSQMGALSVTADQLQTQIATGKRIAAPSDDAAGYQQLSTLKQATADDVGAKANIVLAQGVLDQSDTALAAIEEQLQRAKELALQASSGTLSAEDRKAIATSVDDIIDDVFTLANTRDVRGQAIFGGGGAEAFARAADGTISYVGGAGAGAIPIGSGGDIQVTEAGDRALGDLFASLGAMAAALREGESPEGAIDALGGALDTVIASRASVGARGFRLDIEMGRLADVAVDREAARGGIEDLDMSAAITELQKTLTILQATQGSFTKLSSLSLFDYLR
ncbi:flagellar hook-associated protein FlgL [Sphingomonas qomolangmaensis]|uniref:Flagellar hook-associated protein FlgL n=1 Tax=Sphingomonas qomolangmaensis TaxID=2918765 RepID=A0ABY5L5Q0_9SPHN|nr:flagellar hook-associated protein FlgL [Sphingomonas qomolangmaensis]UUL82284.1 flagellar hook-associated protein FlgL [Sphingomonas qomolangmaensis]